MANQDTKQPGAQPAEDMFGRPTAPRHGDEPAARPGVRDAPAPDDTGSRKGAEAEYAKEFEEEYEGHHMGGIDDISDGDGPRSDRGTNPLPDVYWADFPDKKP
ncbi:MAG: hypothetical protein JXB05_27115 [Myxococcaceae bacterium]|nr:hypothetical protein [Myxococcaceae bacterium]